MDRPTDGELSMARYYGIDTTGLSREELEAKLTEARGRHVVVAHDGKIYRKMAQIATQLGIAEPQGSMDMRRAAIEHQLHALFRLKGIVSNTTIRYADDALNNPGMQAIVINTDIFWNGGTPCILLHMQGRDRQYGYQAHDVALYATVIG